MNVLNMPAHIARTYILLCVHTRTHKAAVAPLSI